MEAALISGFRFLFVPKQKGGDEKLNTFRLPLFVLGQIKFMQTPPAHLPIDALKSSLPAATLLCLP